MITVLTPTFNRQHTLPRLYESLKQQNDGHFEWVVVDDGSTDGTTELLSAYSGEGALNIKLVRQKNGGKHVALNTGVAHATGDWIFIVDSDDLLFPGAIERITHDLAAHSSPSLVGLCYRKAFLDGKLVGTECKESNPMTMNPTDAGRFFIGDLAYVFSRKSMLNNLFPVIEGEKFVPELYIWNKISDQGSILYFPNDAIYLCEYMPDGYTANFQQNLRKNPKGFGLFYRAQFFRERFLLSKLKCLIRAAQCHFYANSNRQRK